MLNIKKLLYLPLIFMFLPAFSFFVPGTKQLFSCFYPVLYFTLILVLSLSPRKFLKRIYYSIIHTPFKIFILLILLMVLNMFFQTIIGRMSYIQTIRSIFLTVGLRIIPICLYFIGIVGNFVSIKDFVKCFLFLYIVTLFSGFIAYIGQYFDIVTINNIFDFLANTRALGWGLTGEDSTGTISNYVAFGLPRLDNLYQEPGDYAHFMCMFLPLILIFSTSNLKLFKIPLLNFLVKYAIIPMTFLSTILTLSPPATILTGILLLILFREKVKKFIIPVLLIIAIIIYCLYHVDLSDTYLSRIVNVLTQIHSFDDFIVVEQSLATRIVSYVNLICIFLHHPIMGVGLGNVAHELTTQFLNSPLPLTPEIEYRYMVRVPQTGKILLNANYYYVFLAENGIILFSIFVYYYHQLFKCSSKLIKIYEMRGEAFIVSLLKSLNGCLISIILIAIYNLNAQALINYMYMIFSLIICIIISYKKGEI